MYSFPHSIFFLRAAFLLCFDDVSPPIATPRKIYFSAIDYAQNNTYSECRVLENGKNRKTDA